MLLSLFTTHSVMSLYKHLQFISEMYTLEINLLHKRPLVSIHKVNKSYTLGPYIQCVQQLGTVKNNVFTNNLLLFPASVCSRRFFGSGFKHFLEHGDVFLKNDSCHSKVPLQFFCALPEFLWQVGHILPFFHFAEKLYQTGWRTDDNYVHSLIYKFE